MGGGSWSSFDYDNKVRATAAAGKDTFDYSHRIQTGQAAAKTHDLLDPKTVAGDQSPFAGKVMREVAISDEHPNPTPIAVVLDVTASNSYAARAVHSKLPLLFGLLQRKGYVEDPQVNIIAIGDANCDRVPLQVGQFESDIRIADQVAAVYLENGGGGQHHETYELAAYYLARHTHLESFHRQGRRGYVIFIGDEMPYDIVRRSQVESLIGDVLEADIPTKEVFEELQTQYEPFFLFQAQGSHIEDQILPTWKELLGENAQVLDDPNLVCEFIAGLLAMREGGLDLDDVAADLADSGFDANAIQSASKTLAKVGGEGSGAIAKTESGALDIADDQDGADRL